ncbi:unnamed protein product [Prunus armeniaca]|uniref:Uncharacterized protein n=1 Tax=Prunus armeniaca TaxID=36596 RepID=A0A6J5WMW2_PRUAR|nr:unnamed protein product [Prunus armeniaca]
MIILCWNCQKLGNPGAVQSLHHLGKGLFLLWKVELDLHIHDHSHPIVLTLRWAIRVINFIGG